MPPTWKQTSLLLLLFFPSVKKKAPDLNRGPTNMDACLARRAATERYASMGNGPGLFLAEFPHCRLPLRHDGAHREHVSCKRKAVRLIRSGNDLDPNGYVGDCGAVGTQQTKGWGAHPASVTTAIRQFGTNINSHQGPYSRFR